MEDKLKLAKDIVASFPQDQRSAFLEKYKSLESDEQRMAIIDKVVTKFGSRVKTEVPKSRIAIPEAQPSVPFTETGGLRASDLITSRLGSRLLGTPEGMSAGEQFKQMYDRSKDSGDMPYAARFANSFATGVAGDVADMALNPLTYAIPPAIKGAAKGVGAILNRNPAAISGGAAKVEAGLDKFIRSVFKAKAEASRAYGADLDALVVKNPTIKADLSQFLDEVKQASSFNPKLASAIKRSPKLAAALAEYEKTGSVSMNVKDIQAIANEFKVSNKAAFNSKITDPAQREVKSIFQDLKHEQAKLFPQEMGEANSKYAQVAQDFKQIRSKLGGDSTENFIRNNFGGVKSQNAVKRLLKNDPQALKDVGKIKSKLAFDKFKDELIKRGAYGVATSVGAGVPAALLLKKYFNK